MTVSLMSVVHGAPVGMGNHVMVHGVMLTSGQLSA